MFSLSARRRGGSMLCILIICENEIFDFGSKLHFFVPRIDYYVLGWILHRILNEKMEILLKWMVVPRNDYMR